MFPIGSSIPRDTSSFQAALNAGLAPLGVKDGAVRVEGDFPQFTAIRADLTGARFHRGLEVSKPAPGPREQLCFARSIEVVGQPVLVMDAPVSLHLAAQDVVLAAADAAEGGGKVLTLERAADGDLQLSITKSELEAALFRAGEAAAKSKGAELKSVDLSLESQGPRSLAVRAVVTAKAMFFTTTVTVSGVVELDDALNARLRNLDCEGDGMIGKMAAGVLKPQFERVEARVFPLGSAVAGLVLTDVTLTGGDSLQVHAKFGAAA